MEKFKTIPSFPDYEVSNFGRVRTLARKIRYVHSVTGNEHFRVTESKYLKVQMNNRTGYKFHQLYRNKKMYNVSIHKLVAEAFIPFEVGKPVINHRDGNKHNNTVDNLERCTDEYNHHHATITGLKPKGSRIKSSVLDERMVGVIKRILADKVSHTQISKWFGIARSSVSLIAEGKTWKHVNALTGEEIVVNM